MPMGGPRPLPSPPIRPQQPGQAMRPSGGVGQQRPGAPRFTPPPMRPAVGRRPDGGDRRESIRPSGQMSTPPPPITRSITFVEGMTVKDLADKLEQRVKDVLKKLFDKRMVMTINSNVDADTATMIAREFGAELQLRTFEEDMLEVEEEDIRAEDVVPRAPVVTVMGHVDHGKTTLLDSIRTARASPNARPAASHSTLGRIVTVNNRSIVFLDTPGHEAFTLMRARGAKITDVVVLVVAADDGVMPQTREAIDHAKAANVPIVVAINKIDKPGADPERVKRELADLNLVPEDWGGQTVMVPVSA
jgi:translation initiation factor IF-2